MDPKIKEEIHKMVDEIEDEAMLFLLKEDITMYQLSSEETLTEEQIQEVNAAIEEDDKEQTVTYEQYKNHIEEWKKKLSSQKDF